MSAVALLFRIVLFSALFGTILVIGTVAGAYWSLVPQLPAVDSLRDNRLITPLRVLTKDGKLIAEFGEQAAGSPDFGQHPPNDGGRGFGGRR